MKIDLLKGWKFCYGDVKRWERVDHHVCYAVAKAGGEVGDMKVFLEENDWQEVCVPHDWNTYQSSQPDEYPSNGFKPRGTGWYYNEFELPEYDDSSCVLLEFEGIMGESVVYVNGVLAARNESGYTGFTTDISDYLLSGEKNIIVVSVDNTRWEGWWYEGAGIYRPVHIYIKPETHLAHRRTFISPIRNGKNWDISVETMVETCAGASTEYEISAGICSPDGALVCSMKANQSCTAFGQSKAVLSGSVDEPKLWSPDDPVMYTAEISLAIDGKQVENEVISFGFRHIEWTDHGMYLNGTKTPVNGICCHQDHVGVGIAINQSLTRYRVKKLKEMGCNAYRCAHNCPSEDFLNACDELGLLVMAENRHYRTSDEVMKQLDEMVLLCRNHPCVFLYSLFNEEPWQAEKRGLRMAEKMLRRVKLNDSTRAVTAAMNGGVLTRENASDVLDVAGMNYFVNDYMKYAERRPGHPMVGTENGPLYATRGVYRDDPEKQVYNSYGLTTARFGQPLQETMEKVRAAEHVAGLFVWGGFDYRGEPQPFEWPSVFSHWGLTDNCGFEKDTFYMLRSYYSEEPMLHLLPHWNWKAGETVRVCAMTNCEQVTLLVNGKSCGTKAVYRNRAEWEVPFEAGEIQAIAQIRGQRITETITTAGPVTRLEVADASEEKEYDCSILNIRLLDENGRAAAGEEIDREVRISVQQGTLIGAGNGNPNGIQPDVTDKISTFMGRCQFLIRPDNGHVSVKLECPGLPEVKYSRNNK